MKSAPKDADIWIMHRTVREVIGPEHAELWDRVENDRKTFTMTLWDWQKIEIALKAELLDLQKSSSIL